MNDLSLGTRIKIARLARGLRQHDVSRDADVPQATLSAIENGRRPPRDHELRAILDALHVSPDDLGKVRA